MPHSILPVIETFTIPRLGWTVTDYRNLAWGEKAQVGLIWTQATVAYVEEQGIEKADVLCEWVKPKRKREIEDGFLRAFERDPTTDYATYRKDNQRKRFRFEAVGGNQVLLGVFHRDRIVGGIDCSNFVVEEDTRSKLTGRAMLWVGVESVPRRADLDVWMDAITFIIDNDLELEDGRTLDLIGYDYKSDVHLRDSLPSHAPLLAFLDRLAGVFDSSGSPDAEGDVKFRRRGAVAPTARIG